MARKIFLLSLACLMLWAIAGVAVYSAALRETNNIDARPVSLYGNYTGTVKRVAVDSNGYVLVNFGG